MISFLDPTGRITIKTEIKTHQIQSTKIVSQVNYMLPHKMQNICTINIIRMNEEKCENSIVPEGIHFV